MKLYLTWKIESHTFLWLYFAQCLLLCNV